MFKKFAGWIRTVIFEQGIRCNIIFMQVPEHYRAVVLGSYTGAKGLQLVLRTVPQLKPGDVLVRMAASPINPSDVNFLSGGYTTGKELPVVPGIEGSGTVVASGGSLMSRYLLGKRVACISPPDGDGTWAEYMVTRSNLALPLKKSIGMEHGSMSIVNPLTALSLMWLAKKRGQKTIVLTAAASSLGLMINRMARVQGIRVINIIHREGQEKLLQEAGATTVLQSNKSGFSQELHDACQTHQCRLAFDAVAGPLTLELLDAMPPGSRVTVYGSLSGEPVNVPTDRFVRQDKTVDGFWLINHMKHRNILSVVAMWRKAQRRLTGELGSLVRVRYPLEESAAAILDYRSHMTGGKVLIIPKGSA